jgi:hypothetical protein
MDNGFRSFAIVTLLAIAVFVVVSTWPGIVNMINPKAQPAATMTAVAAQPASLNQSATLSAAVPTAPVVQPDYTFLQEEEKIPPKRWMYANGNVMLRKEPHGDPFIPLSASFAPLTVHNGTRLWPLRTDSDWVLVQSPGKTLGWVHKDEVYTNEYGTSGSYYNINQAPRRPWL